MAMLSVMVIMASDDKGPRLGFAEFVALTAATISLVALSIDAMLPALPEIGLDLKVADPNQSQLVVTALLLGMALGQLIYGPLSDSLGRRPPIHVGMVLFLSGCLICIVAPNLPLVLAGRFLQGLGVAGPRVVMVAVVRDQYSGRAMARVMSFVMAVFILVPAIAPILGQGILLLADWRGIFWGFLAWALIVWCWFSARQPETLEPERRSPVSARRLAAALKEILSNRVALGYTLVAGMVFAGFLGYLNSAPQLFQQHYGLGPLFPFYFGAIALAIGAATLLNARLVMRLGMRRLSRSGLIAFSIVTGIFLVIVLLFGDPPLWAAMAYFMIAFFFLGLVFGNINALAMEPLGHIAGLGAAVVGSLSSLISVPLGMLVGQAYDDTLLPLVGGFAVFGAAALLIIWWTERGRGH
jgi:DHA1 family bicyclomycin/chloramphenicol resistance-like MFS transporter